MIVRIVDIVRTAEHTICNLHELRLIYSSAMDVYPKAPVFFPHPSATTAAAV